MNGAQGNSDGAGAPGSRRTGSLPLWEEYATLGPALEAWARLRLKPQFKRLISPEDLTQEIWLRATQIRNSFDPKRATFRTWLFSIAKHVLLEAQRSLRRHSMEMTPEGHSSRIARIEAVPDDLSAITRRLRVDEGVARFVDRVSELDDLDRKIIIHCGLEEMSVAEAATRLDGTPAAIAKRWQRLRDRMRDWKVTRDLISVAAE